MRLVPGMATCMSAACFLSLGLGCSASLAQSAVNVPTPPQLSVAPIPTTTDPSPGTPQVTWSTGNGSPGNITVTVKGAKETPFAYGTEGTSPAPWLSAGNAYVFRLYSIAPKRRLLARLRIDQTAGLEVVGRPLPPPITSHVVDRILQLLSFGWVALAALLASMYVIEVSRDR
jgi:hypothetical protein